MDDELKAAIKDIVWMARRYADGRRTYAPSMFNDAYDEIKKHIEFDEENDPDNPEGENRGWSGIKGFPYASSPLT